MRSTLRKEDLETMAGLKVWLADLTYTQQGIPADGIPYGVACVAAYLKDSCSVDTQVRLFKYPESLIASINALGLPDLIGFSSYQWNTGLSLRFAERIKAVSPDTLIMFGGPNFPLLDDERETFLRDRPAIDFFVHGEGEVSFSEFIEQWDAVGRSKELMHGKVSGVFSIDPKGAFHNGGDGERILNLDEMPSPYLMGILDDFIDGRLLPILQTNRGCPFKCTFCTEGADYYNRVTRYDSERVFNELEYIANKMKLQRAKGGRNDLIIVDNNFGMYKQDYDTARALSMVRAKFDWPEFVAVSAGKNRKDRVLEVAAIAGGALRIGGSVQSMDPEVLKNIKRSNISEEQLINLSIEAASIDGVVYSETILGLPGDTKRKHFDSLRVLANAGYELIMAHQLRLTWGAELGNPAEKKRFNMNTKFRAYPQCMGSYEVLGKTLHAVEVEEICIGNSDFTFDEYLECRKLHLVIHIFLNHGMYKALIKFLRENKLSVFRWIELIAETEPAGVARVLFQDYLKVVQGELWNSEGELKDFLNDPDVIEKFQRGELGYNVLWTFKAKGIMECLDDLTDLAGNAFHQLMREDGVAENAYAEFLEDALRFHHCQISNIYRDREQVTEAVMKFDIDGYIASPNGKTIDKFRYSAPVPMRFVLDEEQKELISRYVSMFRDTPHGIGRMMAKIFVNKTLRHPVPI